MELIEMYRQIVDTSDKRVFHLQHRIDTSYDMAEEAYYQPERDYR